jgi:hypothetical protein
VENRLLVTLETVKNDVSGAAEQTI